LSISQKGRIFINYRRADSEGYAGRIYDRLVPHFGKEAIFMDVDAIPAGMDFVEVLEDAVQSCDVLIVLIGRQWLNLKDEHDKRRLDNPKDFVRIEIATALRRDIRVIPVLVGGAKVPDEDALPENLKELNRRNALDINHHTFKTDTNRLIGHLKRALKAVERERKAEEKRKRVQLKAERRKKVAEEKTRGIVARRQHLRERLESIKKIFSFLNKRFILVGSVISLLFLLGWYIIRSLESPAVIEPTKVPAISIPVIATVDAQTFLFLENFEQGFEQNRSGDFIRWGESQWDVVEENGNSVSEHKFIY